MVDGDVAGGGVKAQNDGSELSAVRYGGRRIDGVVDGETRGGGEDRGAVVGEVGPLGVIAVSEGGGVKVDPVHELGAV